MRPIINLDQLTFESHANGPFKASYAVVSDKIGAKKLGYNVSLVPPGGKVCPFHSHHVAEEMFFILEGEGVLRFGEDVLPVRKNDFIACPPGDRRVAHQLVNTGEADLKYIALSTRDAHDVCEYPDSQKIGVYLGEAPKRYFRQLYALESAVDYFHREEK